MLAAYDALPKMSIRKAAERLEISQTAVFFVEKKGQDQLELRQPGGIWILGGKSDA